MKAQSLILVVCTLGTIVCQQTPVVTNAPASAPVPSGVHFQLTARRFTLENKFYYLGNTFKANWYNANKFCESHGMQLASIESSQEYDQFKKVILDAGIVDGNFWTSGTDQGQSANQFFWFSTGKKFSFTNWARGEPDNDFKGTEDCVEVKKKGTLFEWNDRRCAEEIHFVCQFFSF